MAKQQVPNIYTQTVQQSTKQHNSDTFEPSDSETVVESDGETTSSSDHVVKTSFYPTQEQLDKLDDLAGEYNKLYRRQRKRIDRQDIIRHLINQCTLDSLTELQ